MPNYNTPTPKQLREPIISILSTHTELRWSEIVNEIKRMFCMTYQDMIEDEYPSGYDRLPTYCTKALAQLKSEGRVSNPKFGIWRINNT